MTEQSFPGRHFSLREASGAPGHAARQRRRARAFFDELFDNAQALVARFPLTFEPPTMDYISGGLELAVEEARTACPCGNPSRALARECEQTGALAADGDRAVGLNTVGML